MAIMMPAADDNVLARREAIIAALRAIVPGEGVIASGAEMLPYETDGLTAYRQPPMVVVLPDTTEQDYYQGKVTRATPEQEEWVRSHRRQTEELTGTAGDVTGETVGLGNTATKSPSADDAEFGATQTLGVSAPNIGGSR